jgi:hypothetical protein
MKWFIWLGTLATVLGLSQSSVPAVAPAAPRLERTPGADDIPTELDDDLSQEGAVEPTGAGKAEPITVLMRSANWFIYRHGCDTVSPSLDVVLHFHGAHTTVIPRFLAIDLDAVLVIINKGIGSGAYSDALALRANVDGLLNRVREGIAEQCGLPEVSIDRLALSSWSAGYGAIEQFLRLRPELVDAVLLADGLHVGFLDAKHRTVDVDRLDVFTEFARQASQGDKLMAITHSAILPEDYASAGETALALSQAAHAPTWPVTAEKHRMVQVTESRRGNFYVEGYAGNDKPAHAKHLYAIGETSFARLRDYWEQY